MADLRMWVATMVFNARNRQPGVERPVALADDVTVLAQRAAEDRVIDRDEAAQIQDALRRITPPNDHDRRLLQSFTRPQRLPGPLAPMCLPQWQRNCVNGQIVNAQPAAPAPAPARSATPPPRYATAAQRLRDDFRAQPGGSSSAIEAAADYLWRHIQQQAISPADADDKQRMTWAAETADDMLALPDGRTLSEDEAASLRGYLFELATDPDFNAR